MATQKSTDYLRWNAVSMKDLIVEKLNEDGVYSDQIFPGSDLSIIIDVFSYMYDVLSTYVNHGGTEGIFTDAQIYENLNRIVKMLGYNPKGFTTSTVLATLGLKDDDSLPYESYRNIIPKYTTVFTSSNDDIGTPVSYAFTDHFPAFLSKVPSKATQPILYNGYWNLYPATFITQGIPFETFTLDNIQLEGDDKVFVAHNFIDCYIELENGTFEQYYGVTNLYNSLSTDRHFEIRINENKNYTLKFGDNINGKQVPFNSTIYVVYLQSNGNSGQIGGNGIKTSDDVKVSINGLSEEFIKENILNVNTHREFITFGDKNIGYDSSIEDPPGTIMKYVTITNDDASTNVSDLEDVESIRENAPNWFRMGSRLITEQDFKQYVLSEYSSNVYDVVVMNNWQYMIEFQEWLRSYDKLSIDIRNYSYYFSDSCDFNNIYLWVKSTSTGTTKVTQTIKRLIEKDCDRLKPLTSEVVLLDPFILNVTPYLDGEYDIFEWDTDHENKIQLIRDRNTMITVERIQQKAVDIIQKFFNLYNQNLGNTIKIDDLYNNLIAIDGVKKIRTKYLKTGDPEASSKYFDGISMKIWTPHILKGDDATIISGNYKIKSFQFPVLLDSGSITNKIEVLSDSYNVSEVEY